MFVFRDPILLTAIALVPILLYIAGRVKKQSTFIFPSSELLGGIHPTVKMRVLGIVSILRALALSLLVVALARPQTVLEQTKTVSEGVDIVLALDTSTSMLAEDFRVGTRRMNRFDVVREVVKDFVRKRKDDRIGMVAFAGRAYTICPLSSDYDWLSENLDRVRVGMIEDATAIGSAIASSLNRLKTSKTKSKVIILLTDGINNAGNISPLMASEAAKALRVKVYTIGIGTRGLVPYPVKDAYGRIVYQNIPIEIDEALLQKIAEATGGTYYRATDTESLRRIYGEIDRLEKSNIEHFGYREYEELYLYFLVPAIIVLLLEALLSNTVFLRIP